MKPEAADLVKKSKRSLDVARKLWTQGDYDFSVSRLYYALFYIAEALLLTKGLSFSSHSAVLSALHEQFVKPGLLPQAMHQLIHETFDRRQEADYEAGIQIAKEEVDALINRAEQFLGHAMPLLA